MIKLDDIKNNNIDAFQQWFDDEMVSEMASISKHLDNKKELKTWFKHHANTVKEDCNEIKNVINF